MFSKLLEGLEQLGFNNLDKIQLYEDKVEQKKTPQSEQKKLTIEQCISEKSFVCPVCQKNFKDKTIRKTKIRFVGSDIDLKANFTPVDPLYYDVIICDKCGYAAITMYFDKINRIGKEEILKHITPMYKNREYPVVLSIDDVVIRYKLALLNAIVKKAKDSERAYLCLKIGWVYRSKNDSENEQLFLANALIGFEAAYTNESFPMCGLDVDTMTYLIAALNKINGNYEHALKWVSQVVVSRSVSSRLKDKALVLKEEIQKDLKNNK